MTKILTFIEDCGDNLAEAKRYAEKVNGYLKAGIFGNYEVVFTKHIDEGD